MEVIEDSYEKEDIEHAFLKKHFKYSYLSKSIVVLFVWFEVLCPSQQLWSCQNSQFT